MKKRFTPVAKVFFSLLVFFFIQFTCWGVDTATTNIMDASGGIFSKPWIWIASGVLVIIKLLGPFTRDDEFIIVRKKQPRKIKL